MACRQHTVGVGQFVCLKSGRGRGVPGAAAGPGGSERVLGTVLPGKRGDSHVLEDFGRKASARRNSHGLANKTISAGTEVFSIVLGDGRILRASDLRLLKTPLAEDISARPGALRIADCCSGERIVATLAGDDGSFQVEWQAVLRDGDNYVRQELMLRALKKDMPLTEVVLIELPVDETPMVGAVLGSPVAAGNLFFACESPLADDRGQPGHVRCALPWKTVLKAGDALCSASVVGVAPADQMRRAFLYYVERERPAPINRSCTTTPGTTSLGRTGSLTRRSAWRRSSSSAANWSRSAA